MIRDSVQVIDCDYVHPRFAASFLVTEGDRAIFVENNTAHSVPKLLAALEHARIPRENVDFIVITHVHLDHAGGSSALMNACRNAVLLAHPRAARHVIDPSRLVESAKKVYGEANFHKLYGEIGPIEAQRVRTMGDGEELRWGSRVLKFLHTRGHANHHFCVLDSGPADSPGTSAIFTGDSFGLCYPDLQKSGLFVFPSTSPTDFDPEAAIATVKLIAASGAARAFLTHFGEVRDLSEAARQLREQLEFSAKLFDECGALEPVRCEAHCAARLEERFRGILAQKGLTDRWPLVEMDLKLNAAGIAYAANQRREGSTR